MGNATKVALVALLILLVVVVARFVREDSTPDTEVTTAQKPAGSIQSNLPGKVPARTTAPVSSTGQAKAVVPTAVASTAQPAASTTQPPTGGSRVLPQATPGASTSFPTGTGGSRVISSSQPSASQPATQPAQPSALVSQPLPGSSAAQPGAVASTSQSTGTTQAAAPTTSGPSLAGGSRTDLPPPNPIGSLTPSSSGTARPPEDVSRTRDSGAGPSTTLPGPVVVSQLPSGRPTGGASSPFRSLAESRDGGLSSGTAREVSAPEKSSSTVRTENDAAPGDGGLKTGYPKTHVVVKGDTYWGLADHFYGSGSFLHVLEKANPGVKLRPGVKITIPAPPAEARSTVATTTGASVPREPRAPEKAAAPQGSRDYVVQKGDTLGLIAKKFYGDSSKLHLIEQANPDLRYQMLQAGARIKVPAAGDR